MKIEFLGPVYPISQEAVNAFTDILNLLLSSENIMEFNIRLLQKDKANKLSAYYIWSFSDFTFSLWQRTAYRSDKCFNHKLLELQFVTLVCQDRKRAEIITH
ncbi:MAG: hypothetical protein LUH22_10395 [Bacteroides sp.]|nr:hypothetical protein [Bacteroides sp.]